VAMSLQSPLPFVRMWSKVWGARRSPFLSVVRYVMRLDIRFVAQLIRSTSVVFCNACWAMSWIIVSTWGGCFFVNSLSNGADSALLSAACDGAVDT
jgi:hypothetical protein